MVGHGFAVRSPLLDPSVSTTSALNHHCTPFTLPSNGVISLHNSAITLTTNVVFEPQCTGSASQSVESILGRDPFYASTIPQTYVIAAATVIAWILVIMLIITPRTSFLGHSGVAPGFSNGHGIIGGATGGGPSLIGVGSRPWLQKVATLTVAISLTVATADTFRAARTQYIDGYMDATSLRDKVLGSLEIRITRVVSDVFLWLAQVQTLIRLFPRHKEKVLIKWIGFALILFDSLFSCLNSFLVKSTNQPVHFDDAIPALTYLFELALSLLYAAWVIYYAMSKRRYAFYHAKMRPICLIAALSLTAILTPVVFFVTDVSNQDVAGWGDYFRWVGAAAASVVVWEWVERIEALEKDEKKDGILGREIFDGDEMLDVTPSEDAVWTHVRGGRNGYRRHDGDGGGGGGTQSSALEQGFSNVAQRFKHRQRKTAQHFPLGRARSHTAATSTTDPTQTNLANHIGTAVFGNTPRPGQNGHDHQHGGDSILGAPTPPPPVASPVSRADTTSAASTVYVVHYHPVVDIPQPIRRRVDASGNSEQARQQVQLQQRERGGVEAQQAQRQDAVIETGEDQEKEHFELAGDDARSDHSRRGLGGVWHSVPNPFKRKRASLPSEVQQAAAAANLHAKPDKVPSAPAHNFSKWDFKNRLGVLAAEKGERLRDRSLRRRQADLDDLPVTVIPAQPRGSGRTWSPQATHADASKIEANKSSTDSANSSSTLTANSRPRPTDTSPHSPRTDDVSPLSAGGTSSSSRASRSTPHSLTPPRANEIATANNSGITVVIPPPRRANRHSSPLATYSTAATDLAREPPRPRGESEAPRASTDSE